MKFSALLTNEYDEKVNVGFVVGSGVGAGVGVAVYLHLLSV